MKPASKKPTGPTETPAAKAKETKPKTTSKASAKPAAAETKPKAVRKPKPAAASSQLKAAVRLVAHVDVGLGNTLYFRGWGGGLRWDSGTPAVCTARTKWELKLHGVTEPIHFKVLINDEIWSDGPDLTALPSGMLEFNPAFG